MGTDFQIALQRCFKPRRAGLQVPVPVSLGQNHCVFSVGVISTVSFFFLRDTAAKILKNIKGDDL